MTKIPVVTFREIKRVLGPAVANGFEQAASARGRHPKGEKMTPSAANAASTPSAESSLNPDLQELHDTLVGMASDLSDQIGNAQNSDTVTAIVREIDEINHRVTLVGNLLFTQQTAAITKAMDKVRRADNEANKQMKQIDAVSTFIKTVTSFLTLVDKVVDTAKLVMPLA